MVTTWDVAFSHFLLRARSVPGHGPGVWRYERSGPGGSLSRCAVLGCTLCGRACVLGGRTGEAAAGTRRPAAISHAVGRHAVERPRFSPARSVDTRRHFALQLELGVAVGHAADLPAAEFRRLRT